MHEGMLKLIVLYKFTTLIYNKLLLQPLHILSKSKAYVTKRVNWYSPARLHQFNVSNQKSLFNQRYFSEPLPLFMLSSAQLHCALIPLGSTKFSNTLRWSARHILVYASSRFALIIGKLRCRRTASTFYVELSAVALRIDPARLHQIFQYSSLKRSSHTRVCFLTLRLDYWKITLPANRFCFLCWAQRSCTAHWSR